MIVHLLPALTVCHLLCLLRCSGAISKTRGSSQTVLCSCQRELVVIMSRDSRSNVSICSIKVPPALPLGLGDVQTSLHLRRSFEYAEEYLICRDFSQSAGQTRHHSGEKPHAPTGEVKYWEDVSTAPCVSVD